MQMPQKPPIVHTVQVQVTGIGCGLSFYKNAVFFGVCGKLCYVLILVDSIEPANDTLVPGGW